MSRFLYPIPAPLHSKSFSHDKLLILNKFFADVHFQCYYWQLLIFSMQNLNVERIHALHPLHKYDYFHSLQITHVE